MNTDKLIHWYHQNKRDLPWRNTEDPFHIWLSEIILQQTRVVQGLSYYIKFTERFPDVKSLAEADEDEILKLWQGLGYYSRARNLQKAARQVVSEHNGQFPTTYNELIKLAGIGPYTAAAIASIAFNQPKAVVDGNVYRVLSRFYGINIPIDSSLGIKQFSEIANEILDKSQPGIHNQAMMELGALQCVPVNPDCNLCPLNDSCIAFSKDKVSDYPVKTGKIKVTERFLNYFVIYFQDQLLIRKRENKDIWQNLWEFPLIESDSLISGDELLQHSEYQKLTNEISDVIVLNISKKYKHLLTHRIINAQFITIHISNLNDELEKFEIIKTSELENYAVPRLIDRYLNDSGFFELI